MPEADRVFKKHFHAYRPELMVVSGSVIAEDGFPTPLHVLEYWPGHFRVLMEFFFEMFVLIGFGDEVDISQRMSHFMETDIAVILGVADSGQEVIPGKIDARSVYMSHKRQGIISIVVVMLQHIDIAEIIEGEILQSEGQLRRCSADEHGHLLRFLHTDIMEFLGSVEKISPEQPFLLGSLVYFVKIADVLGNNVPEELLVVLKSLLVAIQQVALNAYVQYIKGDDGTEHQQTDEYDFHKVFFLVRKS